MLKLSLCEHVLETPGRQWCCLQDVPRQTQLQCSFMSSQTHQSTGLRSVLLEVKISYVWLAKWTWMSRVSEGCDCLAYFMCRQWRRNEINIAEARRVRCPKGWAGV